MPYLTYANLVLLILFPVSWFAPLLRAGLNLPLFGDKEISVISGLQTLWAKDVFLALVVTFLAILAPMVKTLGLALIHFGQMRRRMQPALHVMGKLAMADVFLMAIYIIVIKGVSLARVEVAWGLYLFTACILASIVIGMLTCQ